MAVFKVARENCEPEQEAEQVRERAPFMLEVAQEAGEPRTGRKTRAEELEEHDARQTECGHQQGVPMQERDARQRQTEKEELDRDGAHMRARVRTGVCERKRPSSLSQ